MFLAAPAHLSLAGGGGGILGLCALPGVHVAGLAWVKVLTKPGSPPPAIPWALPTSESGQVRPLKAHGTLSGLTGVWRPSGHCGGKRWSAKSRKRITQREKQEEPVKQKQQGKVLHLTPTLSYFHFPRR